ncbi:MAG: RNA 2',3'-cyclic phosphodiesterase [Planctomycetaceae bacterium]|nr:RNA 2',3'-cyclic phosphodiesterase [Planctomycetaceae bacterium]
MTGSPAAGSDDRSASAPSADGAGAAPPELVRTFFAVPVELSPPLLAQLQAVTGLGRAVRAVRPQAAHITLRFLGDTRTELLPALGEALREAASSCPPFRLRFEGIGAFPNAKRPSVLWVGVHDADPLQEIVARLEPLLAALGFPAERLPFYPHLTLARIRNRPPQSVFDLLEQHSETSYGSMLAEQVVLYQSVLQPDGPRYTVLETVPFAPEA